VSEFDLKWWRSQIGIVQQEPFLFSTTIFENVAHGLIGTQWEHDSEEPKRRRVFEACEEAFADEFINRLPDVRKTILLKSRFVFLIDIGLRYALWRWRDSPQRRSATTHRHCTLYHSKTSHRYLGRSHERNRCP
jgi:hypothetical protein